MEVERNAPVSQDVGPSAAEPQVAPEERTMVSEKTGSTALYGWTLYAAVMMILGGVWWIIAGIIALADDTFYVVTRDYIFKFDVTEWGWIHLGFGIAAVVAGFCLFTGRLWARIVGVAAAMLAAITAFAWIPYYPVMAVILIAASAAVIWALTVHGGETAPA